MAAPIGPQGPRLQGESMVKKHHDKLQAEKEEAGISKLQASLPTICRPVLALALQECNLDADRALATLRQFQSDAFLELSSIHKRRRRMQASQAETAGSDSDGSGGGRRWRSKKSKRHKGEKSDKSKRHKDKHKKKRRRRSGSVSSGGGPEKLVFGSFGIIRESDYALKRPEFTAWAAEVKRIDVENLPRADERELFLMYIEDFNTCTLPHLKYYNLAAHGGDEPAAAALGAGTLFVNDEALRRTELMRERKMREQEATRQTVAKMMLTKEHVSELKGRELLRLQAQDAYKTGDMSKAQKLMKRLNPDEEDQRDLEQY